MKKILVVCMMLGCLILPGCWYDVPEFQEIGPSESAFLIPLTGNVEEQTKFESEESLKKMLVAAKRVQIPHIRQDTGRMPWNFKWVAAAMLIKVDRQPVTREWTADSRVGTENKDQGVWAESQDSVGFSTGFVISAMIEESDAALFLFRYRNGSLQQVMDTEIRCRVQAVFSDVAAKYDMSDLRNKKTEIISAVRSDVIPFFKARGIAITTIGMTGGFTYENQEIQAGIDKVFIAQREKEITAAQLAAQADKNAKIAKEAEAIANQELQIAKAKAEAQEMMLAVAEKAAKNPVFIQLRELEVKAKMVEKWDGAYPKFMFASNSGKDSGNFLFNLPLDIPAEK